MQRIPSFPLVLLWLFMTYNLFSIYYYKEPAKLKQPDGTVITVFETGTFNDVYSSIRIHNEDDYTIIRDENTAVYCWARQGSNGWLESTGFAVHLYNPKTLGLKPREDHSLERKNERRERYKEWKREQEREWELHLQQGSILDRNTRNVAKPYAPNTDTLHQIVIFVGFYNDDEWEKTTIYFEDLFNNSTPGLNNSLRKLLS